MKEFDYELDYKRLDFTDASTRQLYRIGRENKGFIGTLTQTMLVTHWKFRTPRLASLSSQKILNIYEDYKENKDFIGMDMCRKF